jgi:hypothetical protein
MGKFMKVCLSLSFFIAIIVIATEYYFVMTQPNQSIYEDKKVTEVIEQDTNLYKCNDVTLTQYSAINFYIEAKMSLIGKSGSYRLGNADKVTFDLFSSLDVTFADGSSANFRLCLNKNHYFLVKDNK